MNALFNRFVKDESGATAIEYGLIAALVAVAIIGSVTTLGTKLGTTFKSVSDQLK
jgi:pilus assembly protein Flp/PilA